MFICSALLAVGFSAAHWASAPVASLASRVPLRAGCATEHTRHSLSGSAWASGGCRELPGFKRRWILAFAGMTTVLLHHAEQNCASRAKLVSESCFRVLFGVLFRHRRYAALKAHETGLRLLFPACIWARWIPACAIITTMQLRHSRAGGNPASLEHAPILTPTGTRAIPEREWRVCSVAQPARSGTRDASAATGALAQ